MSRINSLINVWNKRVEEYEEEEANDRPTRFFGEHLNVEFKPRLLPRHIGHESDDNFFDVCIITNNGDDPVEDEDYTLYYLQTKPFVQPHPILECENVCGYEAIWECSICGCYTCNKCERTHHLKNHKQSHRVGINWTSVSMKQSDGCRRVVFYSKGSTLISLWSHEYDNITVAELKDYVDAKLPKSYVDVMYVGDSSQRPTDNTRLYQIEPNVELLRLKLIVKIKM
ncbi:fibronectin-binding protein [Acrasis kona]|uniref:Fibronectin-binding protein n=1 Tax=Acrasis kona TaxID=1008807 RepID=A0AAW2ZJ69_9EUKA